MTISISTLLTATLLFSFITANHALFLRWEGGTNDVRTGIAHAFSSVPELSPLYLRVEVYPTDFFDISEFVSGIRANNELLLSHCDPGEDSGRQFYTCMVDRIVTALISGDRILTVTTTATERVNLQPYKGFVLYVRYTLSDVPTPTAYPTGRPSDVPSRQPSGLPTGAPSYSMHPTLEPTLEPTTAMPVTESPTLYPSISQKPSGPSYSPTTLYPTLAAGFQVSFSGSTNNVLEGVSHTFSGLKNIGPLLLKVEIIKTDFNDANEYISGITVNGQSVSTFCNPGAQAQYSYHTCIVNLDISNLTTSPVGTATIKTVATDKVNCCPYQGKLLHVRYTLTDSSQPTSRPTFMPTHIPSTSMPSRSAVPTMLPTIRTETPTAAPTLAPTAVPTAVPSPLPTTAKPTAVPSTQGPTLPVGFVDTWEGGTNEVRKGVYHTFYGLRNASSVFLRVEVYETDFSDPITEYVDFIMAGSEVLSRYCSPGADDGTRFYLCLVDSDVLHLVEDDDSGTLTVHVRATWSVNTYQYNGYLLYVRLSVSQDQSPTGMPSSLPSGKPSGQPTTSPTGQPSGLPSSVPSFVPTSNPTPQPSGQPTGKPTGAPTGEPSSAPTRQPSSSPTSSMPTSSPTYSADAVYVWRGGSAAWSNGALWNRRSPPINTSTVEVQLGINETITIDEHVVVKSLSFSGPGVITIAPSGGSLTVLDTFLWTGGNFHSTAQGEVANIFLMGNSSFCFSKDVYLGFITVENHGNMTWSCGNMIVTNAILQNEVGGSFYITPSAGDTLSIERDVAAVEYDGTLGAILNVDANVRFTYPPGEAVYDVEADAVVRIRETSSVDQFYSLLVESDVQAQSYYHRTGAAGLEAYNGSIYDEIIENVDVTTCAKTCKNRDWCKSFDFYKYTSLCYLSRFTAAMAGGLTEIQGNDVSTYAVHYNIKSFRNTVVFGTESALAAAAERARNPLNSALINAGRVVVSGGGAVVLDVPLVSSNFSIVDINSFSELRCSLGGTFKYFSVVDVVQGVFVVDGLSGTTMTVEATSALHSSTRNGTVSVTGAGEFLLLGVVQDVFLEVSECATARMDSDMSSRLRSLTLSEYAAFYGPENNSLYSDLVVALMDNSKLFSRNTTIISEKIVITSTAIINATSLGHKVGWGVGAGIAHLLSASGGSHGGIGATIYDSANVSAADIQYSSAYGSSYFPATFGSGGGIGYNTPLGGAGGGIIAIRARYDFLFVF